MDIQYSIIYSERKTLSVIVERDRSVIVRAPKNTSTEVIAKEIEKRKRLILKKIEHNQKYPFEKQAKEFVAGESIMYLGKNYKLNIVEEQIDGVLFDSKFLISKENQKQANKLFKAWYIKSANEIITPKAKAIANQIGVKYNNINIKILQCRDRT